MSGIVMSMYPTITRMCRYADISTGVACYEVYYNTLSLPEDASMLEWVLELEEADLAKSVVGTLASSGGKEVTGVDQNVKGETTISTGEDEEDGECSVSREYATTATASSHQRLVEQVTLLIHRVNKSRRTVDWISLILHYHFFPFPHPFQTRYAYKVLKN